MLKVVGGGGGQDWACSVAGTGLGSEEAAFEVERPGDPEEAGCRGPSWGCAGILDPAPRAGMLQAGAAEPARRQDVEELGERVGGGEERPARHPPAPTLQLLNRKPQGGSGEIKTSENDLQRGRLRRSARAAPPASGMGDHSGQPERSAPHVPEAPAGGGATAVNGLLHNGFHPPPVQPPRLCSRGTAGGSDAAPPRLPLLPELQPQPPPPLHDSPAKKCRLRRRMDSGKKNRPRKSAGRGAQQDRGRRSSARGQAPGKSGARPVRSSACSRGYCSEGMPATDFFPRGAKYESSLSLSLCLLPSVERAD